jgi:hypothetical protein
MLASAEGPGMRIVRQYWGVHWNGRRDRNSARDAGAVTFPSWKVVEVLTAMSVTAVVLPFTSNTARLFGGTFASSFRLENEGNQQQSTSKRKAGLSLFLSSFTIRPWRWKWYVLPKCRDVSQLRSRRLYSYSFYLPYDINRIFLGNNASLRAAFVIQSDSKLLSGCSWIIIFELGETE